MRRYPIVYAAMNKDLGIRKMSSSGGIFYLLAESVVCKKGVIFGAKYDDTWQVFHDYTKNLEDIVFFLGNKYVQSSVMDTYKEAEKFLKSGQLVLYFGTPCQIYGLKAYLAKEYKNLITVDLICHGVPSRRIWRDYLKLQSSDKKIITSINFRDKTEGWLDFSLKINFLDGTFYGNNLHNDLYMKGFLQNIYLRPSCYECRFKGVERDTDITLVDLWGCQEIVPDMFDNQGTSLVLIQSKKGEQIWNEIKDSIKAKRIDMINYQRFNSSLKESVYRSKKRKKYFQSATWINLEKLTKVKVSNSIHIMRKLKKNYKKELMKMKIIPVLYERKELCCGCTACYAICPKEAILMVEDEEGFDYPHINEKKCIRCYQCIKVCPIKRKDSENEKP